MMGFGRKRTKQPPYTYTLTYDLDEKGNRIMQSSLVPMSDWRTDTAPNTFVAFDLANGMRLVGAVVSIDETIITLQMELSRVEIPKTEITRGSWAPLGYRP